MISESRRICPLVADIHFDHRLALEAIRAGMDKIRINPGNIGSQDKVKEVVDLAKEYRIPIRVGVNSGSLEKDILQKYGKVTAEGLAESALRNVALLEKYDFDDIVISLKSSDVKMNYEAYKIVNDRSDYPLHIGVTEAGTPVTGQDKIGGRRRCFAAGGYRRHHAYFSDGGSGRRSALCKGTAGGFRHQKGCDRNRFPVQHAAGQK